MVDRAKRNPKIRFLSNAAVTRWLGADGVLCGLRYRDTVTGSERQVGDMRCAMMSRCPCYRILYAHRECCIVHNDAHHAAVHVVLLRMQLDCAGAFIAIGHKPNTAFLGNQVSLCTKRAAAICIL